MIDIVKIQRKKNQATGDNVNFLKWNIPVSFQQKKKKKQIISFDMTIN